MSPARPELNQYMLRHLPPYLANQERFDQLKSVLSEFDWLEAKLDLAGPSAVAEDFDYFPVEIPDEGLRLLQGAIQLSSHFLSNNAALLAGQLAGRLLSLDESPMVKKVLEQLDQQAAPWLRPLTASLASPVEPLLRIMSGHTENINGILIMQDSRRIISCSDDCTVKIWDKDTGECLRTLTGHTSAVQAVGLTHNQQQIVSFDLHAEIRFWDIEYGNCTGIIQCEEENKKGNFQIDSNTLTGPSAITITSDDHLIFPSDTRIVVWDLISKKRLQILEGHTGKINHVVATDDGRFAISGANDGTARFWDLKEGKCLWTIKFPGMVELSGGLPAIPQSVNAVSILADGSRAIICTDLPAYLELDLKARTCVYAWRIRRRVYGLTLLPNGHQALSYAGPSIKMSNTETFFLWDIHTGKILFNFAGLSSGMIRTVAVSKDGQFAVAGYLSGELKIWNLHNLDTFRKIRKPERHTRDVRTIIVSSDSCYAVSGAGSAYDSLEADETVKRIFDQMQATPSDNSIKVWDVKTGRCLRTLENHRAYIQSLALSTGNHYLFSNSNDKTVKVWNLESVPNRDSLIGTLEEMGELMVMSPDKRYVFFGHSKGNILVWNIETKEVENILKGHTRPVTHLVIISDRKRAVSTSNDLTIKVWDLSTGHCLSWKGHTTFIHSLAVTPDGRLAVTAAYDCEPKVWDLRDGKQLYSLRGHSNWVNSLDLSPDGHYVVTGSEDHMVKIWELATGKLVCSLEGHSDPITSVMITPDGGYIVSIANKPVRPDRIICTINIWDIQTFTLKTDLSGRANSVQILADGSRITFIDTDNKTLRIWDLGLEHLLSSFTIEEDIATYTLTPDGVYLIIGDDVGGMHFLKLEGVKPSPPVVTAWRVDSTSGCPLGQTEGEQFAICCLNCRNWSRVPQEALGGLWRCNYCMGFIKVNPFPYSSATFPTTSLSPSETGRGVMMNIFKRMKSIVGVASLDVSKVYIYQVDSGHASGIDENAEYKGFIQRMCYAKAKFSALWSLAQSKKVEFDKHMSIAFTSLPTEAPGKYSSEAMEQKIVYDMISWAKNMLENIVHKPIANDKERAFAGWLKYTNNSGEPFLRAYVIYFDGEQ